MCSGESVGVSVVHKPEKRTNELAAFNKLNAVSWWEVGLFPQPAVVNIARWG